MAEAAGCWAVFAIGPGLDQLQVVVAEEPEERLGLVQGRGVIVRLERRGAVGDRVRQPGQHGPVQGLADFLRGLRLHQGARGQDKP